MGTNFFSLMTTLFFPTKLQSDYFYGSLDVLKFKLKLVVFELFLFLTIGQKIIAIFVHKLY